jgi:predicted dithiol-disulfide oxidoreductase (DUF899 family)
MTNAEEAKKPVDAPLTPPRIASREEWLDARKTLLARERELTHLRDEIAAERRALPWVRIEKDYTFETPEGRVTLAYLFEGRNQLAIYHFMLAPGLEHICDGCSFMADHVDAARQHFEQADLSFASVSRAPIAEIEQVRKRMGWRFRWVSSGGTDFNYDFGVSFTPEQVANRDTGYNFGTSPYAAPDLPGMSIFAKNAAGEVFHTYSSYARGGDLLLGAYNWLDLVPKGRNEVGIMSWLRLHDEYDSPHSGCCSSHSAN